MKILNELTIKNLLQNKKRTIVTIIGIILSVALMVGIGLLFSSFQYYMIQEVISNKGEYHAIYKDLDGSDIDKVSKINKLKYFYRIPLGYVKINSDNDYKPYMYIEEVNDEFFNQVNLISGSLPKNNHELVISEHMITNGGISYKIGDKIKLNYGKRVLNEEYIMDNDMGYEDGESLEIIASLEYTIVGIMKRNNYEAYQAPGYLAITVHEGNIDKASLYVIFNKKNKIMNQARDLGEKLNYSLDNIEYNTSLLAMYGETTYGNIFQSMVGMLVIMLSLVSIGCIIVIYNSFAISVMERKKQFGLLSSIGATKRQISYMVLFEAFLVGIIGIVLGIASAYLGIGIVLVIINHLIGNVLEIDLQLVTNPMFIVIPVIFMIVVIFISALIPSRRASKISPIEAIRQNDDIKINKKKVKTSKLITKLFGVEGDIALKNIKRNKKKYRVTTISIFISIVLFISFSAYMNYTLNTTDNVFTSFPFDVAISYNDILENDDKVIKEILNNDSVRDYISYRFLTIPIRNDLKYTDEYIKYNDVEDVLYDYVNVIVLDDKSYDDYKNSIGLKEDKIILLNKYQGVSYADGKRVNYDVSVVANENIKLDVCNFVNVDSEDVSNDMDKYCNIYLRDIYVTNEYPYLMPEFNRVPPYKLIINDKLYSKILSDYDINGSAINIVSNNAKELDDISSNLSDKVSYLNINEANKTSNNIVLAIKILMYGFISLVTLIGVTSVFNTISTSMALRKREFAVLRSIGLTRGGFNKILFFESLFFGVKSLVYALPVSFGIICLMHLSLANMLDISHLLIPWNSIILSIVMVFVIVLLTMLYSTNKIKKQNIIEQIREENI